MRKRIPKNMDPRWNGATVACIASGPSLTREDVELVRTKVDKVIVVNATYKMAPWADVCYGADLRFWDEYIPNGDYLQVFKGEGWTMAYPAHKKYGLHLIGRSEGKGYALMPGTINTGGNSGYQAIHLAAYWGAQNIIMLGYDMQRTNGEEHWHGPHQGNLINGRNFSSWISRMRGLIRDLGIMGVKVVNATRVTAIPSTWLPRVTLEEL